MAASPYKLVSIILPIYNQADHIASVVHDYMSALEHLPVPFEMLLIVNNSRDKSMAVCRALEEQYSSVRALESEKGGWGLAVKLGLAAAAGDLLCYTNSARTSPQDLLLLVVYGIANPNVIIKANRKVRENWQRRLGSLLYNLECRALFDLAYWDINGTPKVFPRQFDRLMKLTRDDDLIDLEFNVICRQCDYPMLEVPIFSMRRHGGISTTNYRSAVKLYWGAYRFWRSRRGKIVS